MFEIVKAKKQARHAGSNNREWNKRSRAYVFTQGESILSNILKRRNRPRDLYRSILLNQYPELEGRIKWSQTAGCSCGCSPGFIVDETLRDDQHRPVDIYITAKFS